MSIKILIYVYGIYISRYVVPGQQLEEQYKLPTCCEVKQGYFD